MPLLLLLAFAASVPAQKVEPDRLFVSPMGEPFRTAEAPPEQLWFKGVDRNGDGKLSLREMVDDADRFFAVLDTDKSGEIDPAEIERYESVILPEVGLRSGGRAARDPSMDGPDIYAGGLQRPGGYSGRGGAGLFSYIDNPQPIVSADTNFDRGVSRDEFARAAERRFRLLDANGNGVLEPEDLPQPPRQKLRKKRN